MKKLFLGLCATFSVASIAGAIGNDHELTLPYETVCFSDFSMQRFSNKPPIDQQSFLQIKQREHVIYHQMLWQGFKKEDVIDMLQRLCPDGNEVPGRELLESSQYFEKLMFVDLVVYHVNAWNSQYSSYASQCEILGKEPLTPEQYDYALAQQASGSSNPYADSIPGQGGFGHSYGCNKEANPGCKPHTHGFVDGAKEEQVKELANKAAMELRNLLEGLGSRTKYTTHVSAEGKVSTSKPLKILIDVGGSAEGGITVEVTKDPLEERLLEYLKEQTDHYSSKSETFLLSTVKEDEAHKITTDYTPPPNDEPTTHEPSIDGDGVDETNSTPAHVYGEGISCGEPIDYNQYVIIEDPFVAQYLKEQKEKDAECYKLHGMACDDYEKWLKLNVKISPEMADYHFQNLQEEIKCIEDQGMTCSDFYEYVKMNVKVDTELGPDPDDYFCIMTVYCTDEEEFSPTPMNPVLGTGGDPGKILDNIIGGYRPSVKDFARSPTRGGSIEGSIPKPFPGGGF